MTSAAHALVDSGFLVALCNRRDACHPWAVKIAAEMRGPWLTCEACVCEADHLLDHLAPPQSHWLYELMQRGLLVSQHLLPEQLNRVHAEIARYRNRRVDFADACLVVLSDRFPGLPLATTDSADFSVYFRGRSARRLHLPGG